MGTFEIGCNAAFFAIIYVLFWRGARKRRMRAMKWKSSAKSDLIAYAVFCAAVCVGIFGPTWLCMQGEISWVLLPVCAIAIVALAAVWTVRMKPIEKVLAEADEAEAEMGD